jgi:hypothetical protein
MGMQLAVPGGGGSPCRQAEQRVAPGPDKVFSGHSEHDVAAA